MQIDTDEVVLILSGIKILQDLDVETIRVIAAHTQIQKFAKDQLVVERGQSGERMYFIFKGRVEVRIPYIHAK